MRPFAFLLLLFAASVQAQPSSWLPIPAQDDVISLVAHHVVFSESDISSTLSSAWFLGGRGKLSPRIQVFGDLPVSLDSRSSDTQITIGNPYFGVEVEALGTEETQTHLGLGVRLPMLRELSPDNRRAVLYGLIAASDRLSAFAPETASVIGTAEFRATASPLVTFVGRVSPQVWLPRDQDMEGYLSYTLQGEIATSGVTILTGIDGTGILTEDVGRAARFEHALGIAFEASAGSIRPAASLRFPILGDLPEEVRFILGGGLMYGFD